jgi:hypothetical protein
MLMNIPFGRLTFAITSARHEAGDFENHQRVAGVWFIAWLSPYIAGLPPF